MVETTAAPPVAGRQASANGRQGVAGIRLDGVGKSFRRRTGGQASERLIVLDNISLDIATSQFVCLIGPSGCGKTTLLRMVAGLEQADAGSVTVDGRVVKRPGPERPMVFQAFALLPWATVLENVAFGLKLAGMPAAARREKAQKWLDTVGLGAFAHTVPRELSGGMQQRVGLARALAVDPPYLLMDEPFGALDEITRRVMQDELLRIWEGSNKTVIFVTHSVDEAVYLSDRIVVLGSAPSGIVADIRVDLPRPRNREIEDSARSIEIRAEIWKALGL